MAVTTAAPAIRPAIDARINQAGEVRRRRIESLRGFTALCVVAAHSYAFAHLTGSFRSLPGHVDLILGWSVYVFFALTGYLIFLPFARHWWGDRSPISYSTYLSNRAVRILPIYLVIVVIYTALHRDKGSWSQLWRFCLFWQNYNIHTIFRVDGPMWSLVDEVQFYLLVPVLALALAAVTRGSRRAAMAGVILIGLASGTARLWWWIATSDTSRLIEFHWQPWYLWDVSLPLCLVFFVPGMVIALLRLSWDEQPPRRLQGAAGNRSGWFTAGVALMLLAASSSHLESGHVLAAFASFLLVGSCVLPLNGSGAALRFLDWRPLALLGVASYSLYLIHQPVLEYLIGARWFPSSTIALFVVGGAASVALAAIGYRLIEAPFLRLRRGWSPARATE